MYTKGQGVQQDFVQAVHWSLKAAQQGNVYAQVNLGIADKIYLDLCDADWRGRGR